MRFFFLLYLSAAVIFCFLLLESLRCNCWDGIERDSNRHLTWSIRYCPHVNAFFSLLSMHVCTVFMGVLQYILWLLERGHLPSLYLRNSARACAQCAYKTYLLYHHHTKHTHTHCLFVSSGHIYLYILKPPVENRYRLIGKEKKKKNEGEYDDNDDCILISGCRCRCYVGCEVNTQTFRQVWFDAAHTQNWSRFRIACWSHISFSGS